ncbi:GntR family transcriptional regulator [Acidobacteriota bacterium]
MLLHLTDLSGESLQGQIVRQIRALVLAGELNAGDGLPSIRKLARDHHVSVITVQRAYESLEREELIHSRRSKGFFVSEISDLNKKAMARDRLKQDIQVSIGSALDEGLKKKDISEVIEMIFKEKKAK